MNGPILRMWSTGELRREFRHVNGEEAMVIRRPLEPGAVPVVIMLRNMHVYYPLDEAEFQANAPVYVALALGHLRLPEGFSGADLERTIRRFVEYVQDGFDELKKLRPEDRQQRVVGEVSGFVDGQRFAQEIIQ
jgi:hypothetical protein